MSFYKISSDISCNNMLTLTKKNQDEKEIINIMNFFDLNLIKKNENSFNLIFKKDLV